MATANEYTAEVIVDGEPADEHDDDDEPDYANLNTVTKYAEAVSDKTFHFWTDGEWSGSGSNAQLFKHVLTDLETRDMTNDDDTTNLKEKYGEMRTLKLVLWREQELRRNYAPDTVFDPNALMAVTEKAFKGRPLEVATTYGAEKGEKSPDSVSTQKIDSLPVATFVFKYRTRRALQSLLIIERPPTPLSFEKRDPATLTREELEELVRRQRKQAAVKQGNGRGVKRGRSETVSKKPVRPLKLSKIGEKTVYHIDTEDEDEDEGVKGENGMTQGDGGTFMIKASMKRLKP